METVGGLLSLAGLAIIGIGLVRLLMPSLREQRKRSRNVLLSGISAFVIGAALIPVKPPTAEEIAATKVAELRAAIDGKTAEATHVVEQKTASSGQRTLPLAKVDRYSLSMPRAERPCPTGDGLCKVSRERLPSEWRAAFAGGYQAQRNVAFSLASGAYAPAVVEPQPIQGCAWRIVILATQPASIDSGDYANRDHDCGRLATLDLEAAKEVSVQIMERIDERAGPPH